ncbi:hypothetical protein [Hydrogenimonas cancrithermarum]|uniref:Uncharacterized protein n=1 Tax=Hydrogenimonas cancrithermarum TaxID=2993563 RepID=A0ABN6WXE1_9BACT|nr:hypothetical protein [Hydrogenimonas cancrithermarum]BDY13989.1 hypothetical protein HCR_23020 [Hydrogenimonas cancrithermarum]
MISLRKKTVPMILCALFIVSGSDAFACGGCVDPSSGESMVAHNKQNHSLIVSNLF